MIITNLHHSNETNATPERMKIDIPDLTKEPNLGRTLLRLDDMHLRMVNHKIGIQTCQLAPLLIVALEDRYKASRNRNEADLRDFPSSRDQNIPTDRDNSNSHDNYRRGRSPSPRGQGRRGYRDRDREEYRSPPYRSRSRTRSPSRSPRRGRSPYYGGPPSREVILEGLPLDMVEDDVGHHLPTQIALDARMLSP